MFTAIGSLWKPVALTNGERYYAFMSTVQEITQAIQRLSPAEREELVEELATVLPELNGDAMWEQTIRDPRPRPALSALADTLDRKYQENPDAFPEMTEEDFDRHS